jgi:hypothetical protein
LLTEHSSPVQDDDVDYETEHDHRREQLAVSDPVHTIALRDYFQAQVTFLSPSQLIFPDTIYIYVPCAPRILSTHQYSGKEETLKKSVEVDNERSLEN